MLDSADTRIMRVRPFAHEKNLINYSMSYLLYGRMSVVCVYVLFIFMLHHKVDEKWSNLFFDWIICIFVSFI